MDYRRDLTKLHSYLRHSALIFSLALRKDFARKPAYWIEIYKTVQPTLTKYTVARQWGFSKGGELVQDSTTSSSVVSLNSALRDVNEQLEKKLATGWLLCESQYVTNPPLCDQHRNSKEQKEIIEWYAQKQIAHKEQEEKNIMEQLKIKDEDLPRGVRFKKSQKKRKAKAEW